jgi:hypothetical protein
VSSVPRVRGEDAKPKRVGVTGADDGSPDAASARRNSTQRREKDWITVQHRLCLAPMSCDVPRSRLSSRVPTDAVARAN